MGAAPNPSLHKEAKFENKKGDAQLARGFAKASDGPRDYKQALAANLYLRVNDWLSIGFLKFLKLDLVY